METKPYSLQSPEQIAKDYGGNKQKIAEAMQMGIIDPTAGTLAAMFIDRMRSAAQTEAAPQQSVAQQVFAPPAPQMPMGMPPMPQGAPAGLGATPQAAAMPPMPGGAPMAAPPPPMGMPSPQPVPGMAAGGLAALPIPDDMFDEPTNGGFDDGYRSGGLVAFSGGTGPDGVRGTADDDEEVPARSPSLTNAEVGGDVSSVSPTDIVVTGQREGEQDLSPLYMRPTLFAPLPSGYGGYDDTLGGNLETINQEVTREVEEAKRYREYLNRMLDPAEQKKRRREDMWMTLGQIGARMATTPGSLLQAASTGIAEALPGVRSASAERRGEERAAQQARVAEERTSNRELMERATMASEMLKGYNSLNEALQNNNFRNLWESLGRDSNERIARIQAAANVTSQGIAARASMYGADREFLARRGALFNSTYADLRANAALDPEYQRLFTVNPNSATEYLFNKANTLVDNVFGGGAPPPGAVRPRN